MEGEICLLANREFGLNKYKKTEVCGLPTVEELRASLLAGENSAARERLALLFDDKTFVETGAYAKRSFSDFLSTEKANEFEGVICGYGAIDGKLVFAFAEDASRMGGVIDERHAKKIADLYKLACENGAPIIGIFDSNGTDIFEGTAGLSAYGKIMSCVTKASGVIPQIAFVAGKCIGTASAIAAMFDFIIKSSDAQFYVSSPMVTGLQNAQDSLLAYTGSEEQCAAYIRSLVSYIPDNASIGVVVNECTDNLNKKLGELDFSGEALSVISAVSDNSVFYEVAKDFASEVSTVFATVGGVKCGIVANSFSKNEGKLSVSIVRKITKFVNFCDAFSIPILTLVDSLGLDVCKENESSYFASELAKLAFAYSTSSVPKITVILGHAIGASFVLLGSKSLGADLVYATENSEIGALNAESGVAFAWDKYITLEKTRDELITEWKASVSSPAVAAASGEIDDIISINELRARICSALLMLSSKGTSSVSRRKILPL
jgi:acetyl-CoA carboxylase carboxyltransferase component